MLTAVDVRELYARCSAEFGRRVHAVDGRWGAPTPLPGWAVRTRVRYIVEDELWAPPLFAGETIGPRVEVPPDAGAQAQLLGMMGRTP